MQPADAACNEQAYAMALKLNTEFGFNVIPLKHGEKTPLISWKRYQTKKVTEDDIERWHETHPDCNWGVITGAVSGIVVIDCDDKDATDWAREKLPQSPFTVRTSRGCHIYYLMPEDHAVLKRFVPKDFGINIDVKADGGYVVAPCSLHPSGIIYKARITDSMESIPVFREPDTGTLIDIPNIPQGSRNNAIAHLAGRLFAQGLKHPEVLRQCIEFNKTSCTPPLPPEEVSAIVSSIGKADARNHPNRGGGTVVNINNVINTASPASALVTDFDGVRLASELEDEIEVPEFVRHPGGLLEEVMKYIGDSAVCTVPIFQFGGALSVLSTVLGFKVQSFTGAITNMYIFCIGESGVGKDAPIQAINQLLDEAQTGLYAGSDVASAPAIVRYLAKEHCHRCIFIMDEFGLLLKAAQNPNSPKAELVKTLTELFSTTRRKYTKRYATQDDKAIPVIPWHSMNLFGTSVPSEFYGSMRHGESQNGFLGRMNIWEYTGPLPMPREDAPLSEPPAELIEKLRALNSYPVPTQTPINVATGSINATDLMPIPVKVPVTPEAQEFYRQKQREWRLIQDQYVRDNKQAEASIAARVAEHAIKVSLICTASRLDTGVFTGETTLEDMQHAFDAIEYSAKCTIRQVSLSIAVNDFDATSQAIKKAIIAYVRREHSKGGNADKPGAPRNIIIKGTPGIPVDMVDKVIDRMVQANELRIIEGWKASPTSHRPMTLYCLVEDLPDSDN